MWSNDPVLRFLPWLVFGQGIFLSAAVWSRNRFKSNRYLGALLFLLSLHGLVALAWRHPFDLRFPEIPVMFGCLPFLYGPLVYRYLWHSLYRSWNDRIPFIAHASPAIANLAAYSVLYVWLGREDFIGVAKSVFAGRAPVYVAAVEWAKIVQGLVYSALVIRLLWRHREGLKKWAKVEQRRIWLWTLVGTFGAIWLLVLVSGVVIWSGNGADRSDPLIAAQLASFLAFFYMITFFSLRYPSVLDPREIREEIRKKLNLPDGFVEETRRRLDKAAAARFFIDPEVTLPSLARQLGLHPNALSYIVNENEGMGFRAYLNGLRLNEFLRLADEPGTTRNHLDMAMESGFSSKSTFLRAFRAQYGTTPADFFASRGTDSHTTGTEIHTETI